MKKIIIYLLFAIAIFFSYNSNAQVWVIEYDSLATYDTLIDKDGNDFTIRIDEYETYSLLTYIVDSISSSTVFFEKEKLKQDIENTVKANIFKHLLYRDEEDNP